MPHLSLITLPRASTRWRFMTPYQLHQQLWKGFEGIGRGESENRFLYRYEQGEGEHSVLVQSVEKPSWAHIKDEAEGSVVRMRSFDPAALPIGEPLRFKLRANPVVSRKYPDGITKRIAVGSDRARLAEIRGMTLEELPSREEMLIEWLEKKGRDGGFAIEHGMNDRILCDVGPNLDIVVRKPARAGDHRVTLTSIDFTGVLTVTDVDRFAESLRHGIGRGRAFGCGLLSVARL